MRDRQASIFNVLQRSDVMLLISLHWEAGATPHELEVHRPLLSVETFQRLPEVAHELVRFGARLLAILGMI